LPHGCRFQSHGGRAYEIRKRQANNGLVVEDEPTVRALAESIIEALGYMILSAANAREAIALLEQDEPIDILFTDINLPDGPDAIDGLELARKALELCPSLRVIYTTGHGQTDGLTALFVEDAAFLPKPYRVKQLTEAVLATAEEPPVGAAERDPNLRSGWRPRYAC
jgi:CheY-like chemotaxis protein